MPRRFGTIAAGSFPTAGWFYLEMGVTISSVDSGAVMVRVNGAVLCTVSGLITQNIQSSKPRIGAVYVVAGNNNGANFALAHYYGRFPDSTISAAWS